MLARAVARVFHGIGSVSFPAAKWRDSAFWARYRQHSFREVSRWHSKTQEAVNDRDNLVVGSIMLLLPMIPMLPIFQHGFLWQVVMPLSQPAFHAMLSPAPANEPRRVEPSQGAHKS